MVATVLACLALSIEFKGGTIDDLISFCTRKIDSHAIFGIDTNRFRPFTIKSETVKDRRQLFSKAIGYELVECKVPVYALTQLPSRFDAPGFEWSKSPETFQIAKKVISVSEGVFSLNTVGKGVFRLNDLLLQGFSKPVKIHWFLGDLTISGVSGPLHEEEFLKAISSSSFGTLRTTDKAYEIDLDAKRFRKAYYMWAMNKAQLLFDRQDSYSLIIAWQLSAETVASCTDAQIVSFMKAPGSTVYLTALPRSRVATLIDEYTRATFYPQKGERGLNNPPTDLFEQVDRSLPAQVVLRPGLPCSVFLRYKDGKGGVNF